MSSPLVSLVTGANRGLGFETARRLAALGHVVYVGARDRTKGEAAVGQIADEGGDARWIEWDAMRPETSHAAAEMLKREWGRLDVLIQNAGTMFDFGKATEQLTMREWRETFEVNFFGVLELDRVMLPLLRKSAAGRIVHISSILGSLTYNSDPQSPISGWRSPAYNASKAALNALTALLATELADTPIKVNSAHPGWVKTELGGDNAPMEITEGVETALWLATLGEDGPTGGFFHRQERLPW